MTDYTTKTAKSATVAADTTDVVTFTSLYASVEIVNRSTTGTLWVTLDTGVRPPVSRNPEAPSATAPFTAADDCYPVAPGTSRVIPDGRPNYVNAALTSVVRLYSPATTAYTVIGSVR